MTKIIVGILGTACFVGLLAVGVNQNNKIQGQEKTITTQEEEIDFLEENLATTVAENQTLLEENHELENQVAKLKEKVSSLKSTIKKLEGKVGKQKKQLYSFEKQLKEMKASYTQLKTEIANITRNGQIDKQRIAELENEKTLVRQQMEGLNVQKEKIQDLQKQTEAELLDRQVSEARFRRIASIANDTKVEFINVIARKKRYNHPINRIRNGKGWKYTIVNFRLINADPQTLLDENFIMKIVNSETHEVLTYIESNPNFPNSTLDSKGVSFKFDGNLVETVHYNNFQKEAKNYEIQIFYVDDNGEEYQLLNGQKPLVVNGKVMEMGHTK